MRRIWIRDTRAVVVAALSCALNAAAVPSLEAADKWIELKSAHFTVTSNASESSTRTLAWQLEQIRSVVATLWPWARVDLDRPVAVVAVKDENSMRALVPHYWEQKGGVRPSSVWVSGEDQHYIVIRADLRAEDRRDININPHVNAYFSYVSLILQQSMDRELPLWFSRGLAGVLSNTIVSDTYLRLGPPIPWHLDRLRPRSRFSLPALVKVTRSSPELGSEEGLSLFDAQAWAFVHFLMFGENGARRTKLDQFANLVTSGTDADVAMRESLGDPQDLAAPFVIYINKSIFTFQQAHIDVSVKREGLALRPLSTSESAQVRALLHVAMGRPVEARTAITEARKADPAAAGSFVAEAQLLEREKKNEEAKAAYARAVDQGWPSAYAHYRLAALLWRPEPDRETLTQIEKILTRSIALNNRYAPAYAYLGEVTSLLESGEALSLVRRAIGLQPSEPKHHLSAARVLWRQQKLDDALKEAQAALALAQSDDDRRDAREMVESLERAKRGGDAESRATEVAGYESTA